MIAGQQCEMIAGQREVRTSQWRSDDGSILPLTIFYGVLCVVLVLLVSAATSLYLERERLFALADGAALAGAEAFDLDEVAVVDGHPRPRLESTDVGVAVAEFLASSVSDGFDGLEVAHAATGDGRSATVTLSAVWHPPVVSVLVPSGIRIDVTSSARSIFW
ncbi:MAG: pilus assembly protein TadG-related protein [Humibacter sp.]